MTVGIYEITGNLVFDYFFTLIFVPGMVSVGAMMLFKLLSRP